MSGTSLDNFECNFVVLHVNNLVRGVSFLKFDLGRALAVKAEETAGEEDRVLEVSLDLSLDRVTNQALLLLISDTNTAKMTRRLQLLVKLIKV